MRYKGKENTGLPSINKNSETILHRIYWFFIPVKSVKLKFHSQWVTLYPSVYTNHSKHKNPKIYFVDFNLLNGQQNGQSNFNNELLSPMESVNPRENHTILDYVSIFRTSQLCKYFQIFSTMYVFLDILDYESIFRYSRLCMYF